MTSPQHQRWIRSGMQWRLARPLVALRDRLRGYGYTVYDIGNTSHLDHIPPEDHTPYSETGWPGTTPYGWVTAIDIMPPPAGRGLPSLQALGGQIYDDMQAGHDGVRWLKYMNWGPVNDRSAVHDTWQPDHARRSSSDVGHIHLSSRSDVTQSDVGDDYDPIARLRGQQEEDMTPEQQALLERIERLLTADRTRLNPEAGPGETDDRTGVVIKPWPNGPAELPSLTDWMIKRFEEQEQVLAKIGATLEAIASSVGSAAPLSGRLAVSGTLDVQPAPTVAPLTSPVAPNS